MRHTVVLYSMALAVMVFALKFLDYSLIIHNLSLEVYVGVVALLFTIFGIWTGAKLTRKRVLITAHQFIPNDQERHRLGISKREYEVLELMATGLSNQEIADKLYVSLNTIKTHISNLFLKLEVSRRTQAIRRAKELQLIP